MEEEEAGAERTTGTTSLFGGCGNDLGQIVLLNELSVIRKTTFDTQDSEVSPGFLFDIHSSRCVSSGTDRGLGESPEGDLGRAPNLHLLEKTSTQRQLPITPRKKCDGHTPHPAPGPGPHQDHALVHVLGPGPGPGASQEDARKASTPLYPSFCQMDQNWSFVKKKLFVLT